MIPFDQNNNAHVALLIQWWGAIDEHDRERTFHPNLHPLSAFIRYFTGDGAALMFAADEMGIAVAAWTLPMFNGAMFSLWVRPGLRHHPSAWREVKLAYEAVLDVHPVLVGLTIQPRLHSEHLKLGYVYSGCLKSVFGSTPLWMYELTRERWQHRAEIAREIRENRRAMRKPAVTNGKVVALVEEQEEQTVADQPWLKRAMRRWVN